MRLFFAISLWMMCSSLADDRPNIIVFYTDDHGYADLSCQGSVNDIQTPHVDNLAASGVRALHGYSTAPQCVPSRGGLLTGRFQSKFGLESNGDSLDGFNKELTIAERLSEVGYVTAQFGKWHLGPTPKITDHGFKHVFAQNTNGKYAANITLNGVDQEMQQSHNNQYHVIACSKAASSVIKRYKDQPFFLYIAYRAPHVPLDAPQEYLDRFPGEMPERRRQALAMLSAVDDGVGIVMNTLEKLKLKENTMVFYMADNGAPLKIFKHDAPGGGPGWDGSLNDPLNGEKGMLTEGGIHVPFVMSWPKKFKAGQVYPHPVSTLDVAATVVEQCNLKADSEKLDGVDLTPYLSGEKQSVPHKALAWRWLSQSAYREGDWKYLVGDNREYLFNLKEDLEEKNNVLKQYPEIAERLKKNLQKWDKTLVPTREGKTDTLNRYFDFYLEGKQIPFTEFVKPQKNKKKKNKKI